ncbi:hypothetical protein SAMN00808754_1667 [Thermanaeromonas toyohensis ToBE]|uniref:HicA toxin of toxin-antitoxin n=1 Tax=Thermanaeromonas toyohensis ToBE TaxID=698762 RepID=A0A1W1VTX7_9FIRM|nr:hypothetical protein [Thermanaeromonas toyohensis]SMB96815.1 hypothetical protein SAMN00808754_1667 [Thermanaeromonas toyohensis ToBE]
MPHLPDISYRELVSLLREYSRELRGEGSPVIVGVGRDGRSFTIHQHPSQKVYRQKLAKILRYAGITEEEFWEWYYEKR